MAVAVLEERDQELSREPEYIPKLGRGVLLARPHSPAQLANHFIERSSREPSVGFDRHDLPLPLEQTKQRDDVRTVRRLQLGHARWLPSRPLKRRKQLGAHASLPVGEARGPTPPRDQAAVELHLASRYRFLHDELDKLGWNARPRAKGLEWRPRLERRGRMMLVDQAQKRLARPLHRPCRIHPVPDAARA